MHFLLPRRLVACAVLLFAAVRIGEGSCGSVHCPFDTRSALENKKGLLRVGYEFEFIDQDQPRVSSRKAAVGQISGHHDEQRTINRLHRFIGTWGVTDRLGLELALPMVSRSHRHIHNHHGGAEIIPEGWDFSGLGDLAVQGRYAFYKPERAAVPTLSAIVGMEFPTGKSDVHNADGDHAEPGITPGSASYDPLVGGSSLQHLSVPMPTGEFGLMPLFVSLTYKFNGKGHDDYRIGNMLSVNAGVTYPLTRSLGAISQFNLLVRRKDDAGSTHEEVEKTGGEFLYYSPGLELRLLEVWQCAAVVQIPVRQRVNEIQLTSAYNLILTVSRKFQIGS